ncbi:MAG: hypothetical protein V3U84_01430, partial [Thiotrichaceae bacterium]
SLDGLTGTQATSGRFFKHVPEMRAQYGSLYPASYYRLQEAYALKDKIQKQDKLREAYFNNFDITLNSLDGDDDFDERVNDSDFDPGSLALQREEDSSASGDTQTEADQQRLTDQKLDNIEDKVDDIQKQLEAQKNQQDKKLKKKQKELEQRFAKSQDQDAKIDAEHKFESWQTKMANLRVRAGKRNIVNNYVWDADGGLHTESEEFATTVEHTIGSEMTGDFTIGAELAFNIGGVQIELSPMASISLGISLSKTESTESALALEVELDGVERMGITDFKDRPLMPGEKVDRYRFMSFYMEGASSNFDDFFNYVVNPEWLASNDEEARALREVQAGKPGKPWRVLHRVTYVERPALMNFGQDIRPLPEAQEDEAGLAELHEQHTQLEEKVDRILGLLQSGSSLDDEDIIIFEDND